MKSMVIRKFGSIDVFEPTQMEMSKLLRGHVLIDVVSSSVNPVDVKIRQGALAAISPEFPAVLHGDVAGTIAQIGEDVEGFSVGDRVMACGGGVRGMGGALSDKMAVDVRLLSHAPESMSLEHCGALPLVGITAWTALIEKANLHAGQTILIHGVTGGVSHIAIQLARSVGARVFATCSNQEKADIAKGLGAENCFDYTRQSVQEYVEIATDGLGFDVVFDTVGGENIQKSFEAAKLNGSVVSVSTRSLQDLSLMHSKGLSLHVVFMLIPLLHNIAREGHGEILQKLAKLVDKGDLTVMLDQHRYAFADVAQAHQYFESGKAVGKVLLLHSVE